MRGWRLVAPRFANAPGFHSRNRRVTIPLEMPTVLEFLPTRSRLCRTVFAVLLCTVLLRIPAGSTQPGPTSPPWDLHALEAPPQWTELERPKMEGVKALTFEGLPFRGQPDASVRLARPPARERRRKGPGHGAGARWRRDGFRGMGAALGRPWLCRHRHGHLRPNPRGPLRSLVPGRPGRATGLGRVRSGGSTADRISGPITPSRM